MLRPAARSFRFAVLSAGVLLLPLAGSAEIVEPEKPEPTPFDHLEYRNVGPVNMSGRVADVEGVPGRPNVLYVGSASGALAAEGLAAAVTSAKME